jgi:D-alanyl-D-alanine carboxypeptidase (penicillin-binding protein 5/6)
MHLIPGEKIKVSELVHGMLIASANDAALALEEFFGKEKMTKLMNEKAIFLGLENTKFVESTGLDEKNVSTVKDLAFLTSYALKNPYILRDVSTKEYTAISSDGKIQHKISTTNRLLKNYPDIFGVKTGYTQEAGNCLIASASQNGHQVLSIVLNINDNSVRFNEARKLLDWTFANFKW